MDCRAPLRVTPGYRFASPRELPVYIVEYTGSDRSLVMISVKVIYHWCVLCADTRKSMYAVEVLKIVCDLLAIPELFAVNLREGRSQQVVDF